MSPAPDDPTTAHGRRQIEERQEVWNSRWEMFRPAPGVHREPIFHIDIPTLILSIVVGFPVGTAAAIALTGQPGMGGFVGIFPVMLVFGYFRRRIQRWGSREERIESAESSVPRSPRRILITRTIGGATLMALLGVWFASSEGDLPLGTAGIRFGMLGACAGFLVGLIAVWRTRRSR
ncbi:MAG TPA: hypothetical protein VFN22_05455 [Gemmatimonadales bacterium]|nr:hypothetical protein [Gemmatimonadales bacterium]